MNLVVKSLRHFSVKDFIKKLLNDSIVTSYVEYKVVNFFLQAVGFTKEVKKTFNFTKYYKLNMNMS